MKHFTLVFIGVAATAVLYSQNEAGAGAYLSSAHGNTTYGVYRASTMGTSTLAYSRGNCVHCHEQHASIGGSEPTPTGGPSGALLFYNNFNNQTDGACFQCHMSGSTVQSVRNRSYSYRAGGWSADTLTNIKDAFAFTAPLSSSHNLANIVTFISAPARAAAWNYNGASNPCTACHNPHAVQGDPANLGDNAKASTAPGWMLSRPSKHGSILPADILWGDGTGERMSDYAGLVTYQPPYKFGGGTNERDAAELTDFNTFCIDCHNATNNSIASTTLGTLKVIDWSAERHGLSSASSATTMSLPYNNATSYVLSCTDCHEPHGSPNIYLIRREVNNGLTAVDGSQQQGVGTQWGSLCGRCHSNIGARHAALAGGEYTCTTCHDASVPVNYVSCATCHYHGSVITVDSVPYRTF